MLTQDQIKSLKPGGFGEAYSYGVCGSGCVRCSFKRINTC